MLLKYTSLTEEGEYLSIICWQDQGEGSEVSKNLGYSTVTKTFELKYYEEEVDGILIEDVSDEVSVHSFFFNWVG